VSSIRTDDTELLLAELKRLRSALGDGVELLVGGAAAAQVSRQVKTMGAQYLSDLNELRQHLREAH
jgi:hypothetical protein